MIVGGYLEPKELLEETKNLLLLCANIMGWDGVNDTHNKKLCSGLSNRFVKLNIVVLLH